MSEKLLVPNFLYATTWKESFSSVNRTPLTTGIAALIVVIVIDLQDHFQSTSSKDKVCNMSLKFPCLGRSFLVLRVRG